MKEQSIRLWKNGILKELSCSMFGSDDAYQQAIEYWYGEGWDEYFPN